MLLANQDMSLTDAVLLDQVQKGKPISTNACQPPMETYIKIAKLLEVELSELVNSKFGDTI